MEREEDVCYYYNSLLFYFPELRRTVYSSSSSLRHYKPHTHTYSSEIYDESKDEWTKTCKDCGHSITFQKL